jgi:cell division protein FtsW
MILSRTDQSFLGQWWWTVDRGLIAMLLMLLGIGVFMVATASPSVAERIGLSSYHFVFRHLLFIAPAIIAMIGMSFFSPRSIWRISSIALLVTIGLLVAVLIFGKEIKGAQRWLEIGIFSIQPSEFIKPLFAVVGAWLIARGKDDAAFPGRVIAMLLYALLLALLLSQPDYGQSMILTLIACTLIGLSGIPFWVVGLLIGGVAFLSVVSYFTLHHVRSRFDRFFDKESGDNYQIDMSLDAFKNGGLFGKGLGQGEVKNYIPDVHSDFIFSVVGEEFGFVFTMLLLVLYVMIIKRIIDRTMESKDLFPVLAVSALVVMFAAQIFIHMGSATRLSPSKGMTLPFLSYGGSSLWGIGLSMGMILGLTRRQVRSTIVRTPKAKPTIGVNKI